MTRRMLLLGLVAAAQLSTGCWCVRERIAWRWHNHPGIGAACGPAACGPVCAPTPAFRIPSPAPIVGPVYGAPVYGGPVGGPGCAGCTSGIDPVSTGYAIPVSGPGSLVAPPVIGAPMPLHNPRVEGPTPMTPPAGKN